jgi:hypothetical protein
MTQPEVVRCADGFWRRVIYGLGPYIADYPEQVLLTCIVQGWCARYVLFILYVFLISNFCRCTSPPCDFEGSGYVHRSREHTELLAAGLELGVLWDEYGLLGDLVVRFISLSAYLLLNY